MKTAGMLAVCLIMKIPCRVLSLLGCVLCGACVPGKFASRVDGVVVDSKSSEALAGTRLISKIPHRDGLASAAGTVEMADEDGRFSFGPEYGIFKLLTPDVDWREIEISKDGYKGTRILILHRGNERFVTFGSGEVASKMPRKEPLLIRLERNRKG